MMMNPMPLSNKLRKKYEQEVTPWLYVNEITGCLLLKEEAPTYVHVLHEVYLMSLNQKINIHEFSKEEYFQYYQKHQHLFR